MTPCEAFKRAFEKRLASISVLTEPPPNLDDEYAVWDVKDYLFAIVDVAGELVPDLLSRAEFDELKTWAQNRWDTAVYIEVVAIDREIAAHDAYIAHCGEVLSASLSTQERINRYFRIDNVPE